MLDKLKQAAVLINIPVWVVMVSLVVICMVIIKLIHMIFSSKPPKNNKLSSIINKNREGNTKTFNKKKKNKKQRPTDIPSQQKGGKRQSGVNKNGNLKVNTPTLESGGSDEPIKKPDIHMGKLKKRKSNIEESSNNPEIVENHSTLEEEGEWQTVCTKEQRAMRREKKRHDPVELLPPATNPVKQNHNSLPTLVYAPIPSMAKDIAPRFARAAGEEWREGASKRQNASKQTTIVNRTPMIPTNVLDPSMKWLSSADSSVIGFSSNQPNPWTPMTSNNAEGISWAGSVSPHEWQGKPDITSVAGWEEQDGNLLLGDVKSRLSSPSKHLQFGDVSPSSVKSDGHFLLWAPYSQLNQSDSTIQPPVDECFFGNPTQKNYEGHSNVIIGSSAWGAFCPKDSADSLLWSQATEPSGWLNDKAAEDWVHVTTPSRDGSNHKWSSAAYSQGMRQWSDIRTGVHPAPPGIAQAMIKREKFLLEPEGYSVSSLEPDDPWNLDNFEKGGDWSPPEASWSNTNDEWAAPTAPPKPQPTYFDDSSEDEKIIAVASSATNKSVVGAGSDIHTSTSQTNNKKPRRRRRKKTTDTISEVITKASEVTPEIDPIIELVDDDKLGDGKSEQAVEASNAEEWAVSKSKKKRPRVRKDE